MRKILMIVVVLAFASAAVFAADPISPEDEQFLYELAFQLRTRGWNEDELGSLMEQARLMRWDEGRAADPAVVAFALHHGAHDWNEQDPEQAFVRAQLALQLAISTQQMERLGYGAQAIAQGAARGVSEAVAQIRAQTMTRTGEDLGTQVRTMVRSMVAREIANQQQNANRAAKGSNQQFQMKPGVPGAGMGNRPANAGGGPK